MFPLELIDDIQNSPQDFKLLERVPLTRKDVLEGLPLQLNAPVPGEKVWPVVFVDIETTGVEPNADRIIELGMVRCIFSLDRRLLLTVERCYSSYEDPKVHILEDVTRLTGITDELVKDQRFNDEVVLSFFVDHPLIVAHNAKFVRPFMDRRFRQIFENAWASSQREIDWSRLDINGTKLEFLTLASGYFYEGHKACNDALTVCFLLYKMPEAFQMLIESSLKVDYQIDAFGSPFDKKNQLKEQNYRWDGDRKVWYITVSGEEEVANQLRFLESVYPAARSKARITAFTATERYRA